MDGGAAHTETGRASGLSRRWPWLTARRIRLAVILAVLALAAIFLFRFLSERARYVATADARIASDMVAVSTDISGRITTLAVSKGDRVAASMRKVRFDGPTDPRLVALKLQLDNLHLEPRHLS